MRFLYLNETTEWCRDHGMAVAESSFDLLPDKRLIHQSRLVYAPQGPVGREAEVLEICAALLGQWDECLFWPTAWDIWEGNEDWPRLYGARGARGEHYSLAAKPGHVFHRSELADLRLFLAMAIEGGWDAHLLPVFGSNADRRFWNSHDGWIALQSRLPESLPELAV